jgi:hypothetical protein
VLAFTSEGGAELVALSASRVSRDTLLLERWSQRVGEACAARGIELLLGGEGLWPDAPMHGTRLRTFEELQAYLAGRQRRPEKQRA